MACVVMFLGRALRLLTVLAALSLGGAALAKPAFVPGPTQYIAALGDPSATSGADAQTWGFWSVDPGPRGVWTHDLQGLVNAGNRAPAGWTFDPKSWWLEEHGLIMEAPSFPLPAGQYVVTGGREITAVLTIAAPDAAGKQAWSLSDGATIYDVTHLRCRAALYRSKSEGEACSPDKTPTHVFPMDPGRAMPAIQGCSKQDYQVLIVIGMMTEG